MLKSKLGKKESLNKITTELNIRKGRPIDQPKQIKNYKVSPSITNIVEPNLKQKSKTPVTPTAVSPKVKIITKNKERIKAPQTVKNKLNEDLDKFEAKINSMALVDYGQEENLTDPLAHAEMIKFINQRGNMDSLDHTELLSKMIDPNKIESSKAYLEKIRV